MTELVSVMIESKNPGLVKTLEKIVAGVQGFRLMRENGHSKVDLLIYDIGADITKDLEHVQMLMNMGKTDAVFLTSENSDPSVLMQAIRIGAKEFISQPVDPDELRQALGRLRKTLDTDPARRPGEVFTFMGSKGGVGTTTVAVNLAVALQQRHAGAVALVDMNLLFGEIPLFLNFKPQHTWAEIAKNITRLDDAFLNDVLFEHSTGIHVLPSPSMFNNTDASTPQLFMRILSHMRQMFDYIIIDGGNSLSDMSLKTLEVSNRVFLISLLSLPCLSNTGKLLRSFEAWGYPPRDCTDIIINRHIKDSEISIQDAEKSINKKIFWKIPNDYASTMSAINQGIPLSEVDLKTAITRSFCDFAGELAPGGVAHKKIENEFFKKLWLLKPMFGGV